MQLSLPLATTAALAEPAGFSTAVAEPVGLSSILAFFTQDSMSAGSARHSCIELLVPLLQPDDLCSGLLQKPVHLPSAGDLDPELAFQVLDLEVPHRDLGSHVLQSPWLFINYTARRLHSEKKPKGFSRMNVFDFY